MYKIKKNKKYSKIVKAEFYQLSIQVGFKKEICGYEQDRLLLEGTSTRTCEGIN